MIGFDPLSGTLERDRPADVSMGSFAFDPLSGAIRWALGITEEAFSPLSLFAAGEQGAWYDPSDFSTMFTTAAGTTPVTAVEQPVGLILDKSKGLVLGPELVTNGGGPFTVTTGWTAVRATLSVVAGKLRVTQTSGYGGAYQAVTLTGGITYKFTFPTYTGTAEIGTVQVFTSIPTSWDGSSILSGSGTLYYTPPSTGTYYVGVGIRGWNNVGLYADFTSLSMRSIAGNHASQPTSAARPVLSARVNLLTYTQLLAENSATAGHWVFLALTGTDNFAVAPDGTLTGSRILETTANSSHSIYMSGGSTASATTYTTSFSVKGGLNRDWCYVNLYNANAAQTPVYFNVSTGVVGNLPANTSASITLQPNGWYRCAVTRAINAGTAGAASAMYGIVGIATADGTSSYAGNTSSGLYVWGADLRVANDGVGLPPYQRVGAGIPTTTNPAVTGTADYDTVGFPQFLAFDGVDDWMAVPDASMPVSGFVVAAGINAVSSTASKAIIARAYIWGSFQFVVRANNFAGFPSKLACGIGRTGVNEAVVYSSGTADSGTVVVVGTYNKTAVTATTNTAAAESANYNQDITYNASDAAALGAFRTTSNVTASRMNGRLYGLVLRSAASSAEQIANLTAWMNSKTKAYTP